MREQQCFKLYSLGVATHRDDWVYDFNRVELATKSDTLLTNMNNAGGSLLARPLMRHNWGLQSNGLARACVTTSSVIPVAYST